MDALLCVGAIAGAFFLRDFELFLGIGNYLWPIVLLIAIKLFIFKLKGLYSSILRYSGGEFLTTVIQSVIISAAIVVFLGYLGGISPLPRSVLVIDALLTLVFVGSSRFMIRYLFKTLNEKVSNHHKQRLIIYGAGETGSQLARSLHYESQYEIVGFVDDNAELHYQLVEGFRVYNPADLAELYQKKQFQMAILAIADLSKARRREIVEYIEKLPIIVKTLPTIAKLMSGEFSINNLRNIDVTELLGR
ncbi:MAG: polysaccharide biosynthesis protein, partial [Microcystaceae cyanobacterium]